MINNIISTVVLLGCGTLQAAEKPIRQAQDRPNVLFIAVDDLNDWAGNRGNKDVITPNMDQLAGEGMWFSKAYCQYAVCGPSRASLMSGVYYHQLESKKLQADDQFVEDQLREALLESKIKEQVKKMPITLEEEALNQLIVQQVGARTDQHSLIINP